MNRSASSINIPNMLTVGRLLLTPVFVVLLLRHLYWHALVVFTIAGVSDALDGFIARHFNQSTSLGAHLDPIADKLLLASAFVTLAFLGLIPAWITMIVIARDAIIGMGIAIITLARKPYEIRPSIMGKGTTLVQVLYVIWSLFDPGRIYLAVLHPILLWSTTVVTTLSCLQYIIMGIVIVQAPGKKP